VSALPKAVFAALLAHTFISAGTHLAARASTTALSPMSVAVMRMSLTAVVFLAIIALHPAFRGQRLPPKQDRLRFLFWGFVAGPMNQGFFLAGIERSVASHASLLYALTPVGVYLASIWLGRERWSRRRILGVSVALAGVIALLLDRGLAAALAPLVGDLLLLCAVVAWVAWTLASRDLARRYSGLQMASWTMLAAGLQAALCAPFLLDLPDVATVPTSAWLSLGYLVAFTSVVAYILWSYALVRAEASRVAVFTNLQPVFTALFAWLILGEPIGWGIVIGGALVILGVRIVQRAPA
jgi:drug/metabolite transporter (DMT)-like permease